jgi:hypothetical protein
MAAESYKTIPAEELPTIRASDYREVYVNHARAGSTSWDVLFTFGALSEPQPNQPAVVEHVTVRMTVEFARALVGTLVTAVNAVEHERQRAIAVAAMNQQVPDASSGKS